MKRIPPDPDRFSEHQHQLGEFAASPPYPVHGLRRPVVVPAYLARWETENGETTSVQLAYGDWSDEQAPFLGVTTGPPGSAEVEPADLLGELRREHRLKAARLAEPVRASLPQGELCRVGESWALRMVADGQTVTVIGRGVEPQDVELGRVLDLRPYVGERSRLVQRLAAEPRALPAPVLAPASGIAALRAFVETFLPDAPDAGPAYGALGRRAVAELDRVLGCGPERAEYLVSSMVNQITQLRAQVPWFSEPDGPRAAAVEELLRHVGLGQPVDSEAAQELWERYWAAQQHPTDTPSQDLRELWVQAWEDWERGRGHSWQ
ncbi:hypothetical protein [Kitasatospora azatica]|uniref:hypothetical protein n=1 Tax=Kitasatospora azatica TaxID=58347 RepID=UPI00056D3DC4|nr:hypothetical protein [Kitasatospora azatica]